jgi:DNA-binding transcriptional regulator YdaS (Cro superfamily)
MKQAKLRSNKSLKADLVAHFGSMAALARALGVTRAAVSAWQRVPLRHLIALEKMTGIDRSRLRPDLYE